jgi:hypothetical protein
MADAGKNPAPSLGRRWRAALALSGLSQEQWAKQHRWTASHVSQVLSGKRESEHVVAKVRAFVEEQEHAIASRIANQSEDSP